MKFSIRFFTFLIAIFLAALFLIPQVSLSAPVETVTNTNDMGAGSLRQAIADVDPGGTVNFNIPGPGPHTIGLMSEINIDTPMTINGPGADVVTIDAQMMDRIFNIDDGLMPEIAVSISGLRFINGSTADPVGGGAIFNIEELSIDSCKLENNMTTGQGGAISNRGTITEITHCTFDMNIAGLDGGGISNNGAITKVTHTTFTGNMVTTQDGGAIFNNNGGTIGEITYSTFSGNMPGGAIFNNSTGVITTIAQCTFEMNEASAGGAIQNPGTIDEITHCTFSGNMAATFGGAIYNNGGTITAMTNCTLSGNMAQLGGAIFNFGTMNISFSTIANNTATNVPPIVMNPPFGGGILHGTAALNIKNSIVGNNTGGDCFPESGTFTSLGGNLDTDGTCTGFTQVIPATDLNLDPNGLQDNGGPTDTIALCTEAGMPAGCAGASVAFDAVTLMNCTDVANTPVTTDQRSFPRPGGPACDVGAYEAQSTGMLTIVKETLPEGGIDFEFLGESFPGGCGLDGTFFLDDNQQVSCILPEGSYTVEEVETPADFSLGNITCTGSPTIENSMGVTVEIGAGNDITCTFTNLELAIILSPEAAINDVFSSHTVTARVVRSGEPQVGVEVTFEVIAGPNQGETSDPDSGECSQNDDCTTDFNGEVSWTYSSENRGTDTIVASFFDEEFQITVQSNTVSKTWRLVRNVPTLSEWGLIAMAAVLGLVGLFVMMRRVRSSRTRKS